MADAFKFVQNQYSTLAGAGCLLGATSITLVSFTQINGTPLTMSDFGAIGFGTLEPGNGTHEEQICWTGITENSNGTATLTGVSSVAFVYPYTQTSGTSMSHSGGIKFIVTNTAGFYDQLTSKQDDEIILGTWTFTNPNYPRMDTSTPSPTDPVQLVTKAYADSLAIQGAPNASTSVQGLLQLPTQAQVDAKTTTGSTGAPLTVTPATQRSTLSSDYVADTGTANAYLIAPSPVISAYAAGQTFSFKATNANTTTSTVNVNSVGAKTIKKGSGNNLTSGDIAAGQIVVIEYDGTNFQLVGPVAPDAASQAAVQNSAYVYAASSAGTDTYAITTTPAPTAYVAGQVFYFKADVGNTGAATLNVNTLGAKTIKKAVSADLADNDIIAGQVVQVQYDGTNFQLMSPTSNALEYVSGVVADLSTTAVGNNDVTITTSFTPRLIKLYYWIQGHTDAAGSNTYTQLRGMVEYNATTLVFNNVLWQLTSGTENTAPTAVAGANLIFAISPVNTAAPTIGAGTGSGAEISITLSIASVATTNFVIRRATATQHVTSTARASISYEAYA